MRSAAPCGAAKDPVFFVYRAVDVRRRWSCACLLVLFCRCVAPDHALCFVSVLSAYSLQASCVVFEALRGDCGFFQPAAAMSVCLWRPTGRLRSRAALGGPARRNFSESLGRSRGVTFGFFFVGRLRPAPQRERPFGSPGVCSGPPRRLAAASRRRVLGGWGLRDLAGSALGSRT